MSQTAPQTQSTPQPSNGPAVASLVLGILSITGFSIFTGIPAVITGFIGLKNPFNRGMAIAGLVMGGLSILIAVLIIVFAITIVFLGGDLFSPETQDVSPMNPEPNMFDQRNI